MDFFVFNPTRIRKAVEIFGLICRESRGQMKLGKRKGRVFLTRVDFPLLLWE